MPYADEHPEGRGGVPRFINLPCHIDARGSLGVVEDRDLPFPIRRCYYLFDVPIGAIRGEHGHKTLEQVIICMHGHAEITLNDGRRQYPFTLDRPSLGLYVPPGLWRRLRFHAPDTVVCVLASQPFDVNDYIYSYEEFLAWVRGQGSGAAEHAV